MRLFHTADVHVGRQFKDLGSLGKTLRQQIRHTFAALLRLAAEERANLTNQGGEPPLKHIHSSPWRRRSAVASPTCSCARR